MPPSEQQEALPGACANYVSDFAHVWWPSDAVGDVYTPEPAGHGYASPLDGVAMSLKAGTDMDCGDWGKKAYLTQLPAAVKAGKVSEADLDRALLRLTTLQMELGLFDPKANSHFFTLGVDLIHSDEHTRHALEASQQSIVLLKNNDVLPFKKGVKIAVLGPHSDGHEVFLSNYHGSGCLNATGGIGGSKDFDCIQSPLGKSLTAEKLSASFDFKSPVRPSAVIH